MVRGWETPDPAKNVVTETQEKFMSWKLQNLASGTGWAKLGLLILAGLIVANAGRAQTNFASAQVLPITNNYGSVICDNTNVVRDTTNCPNIAGFVPRAPLWFKWTAPPNGNGCRMKGAGWQRSD